MNPLACRVVLRPRGPGELVDLAVRLGQVEAGALVGAALRVLGPLAALILLSPLLPWGPEVALAGVLLLAPGLQVPFVALGARLLFEEGVTLGALRADARPMLRAALVRWGALVAVWGSGLMSFGIAFLPAHVGLAWIGEVVLLERTPVRLAWARTVSLASDEAGVAVGSAGLGLAVLGVGALTGEALGQLVVAGVLQLGTPLGALWAGEVTPHLVLGTLGVQPLLGWVRLLAYVDARTRREGWDLQVALRAAVEAR